MNMKWLTRMLLIHSLMYSSIIAANVKDTAPHRAAFLCQLLPGNEHNFVKQSATNQPNHQNFKRYVYFVKSYPISPIQCILPVENNCRPFSFLHRLTLRWKVKESLHLLNWIFEVTETALVRIVIKLSVTPCFWNFPKIVVFLGSLYWVVVREF